MNNNNNIPAFAQLGYIEKSGNIWSTGNTAADLGIDLAASSNPFTGVPYHGANMVNNLRKGNWGSALGDLGWGALSFLPGAGTAAKAAVKGGAKVFGGAAKATAKANKATNKVNKARAAATGKPAPPPMPGRVEIAQAKWTPQWLQKLQTGGKLSSPTKTKVLKGGLGAGMGGMAFGIARDEDPLSPHAYGSPQQQWYRIQNQMEEMMNPNPRTPGIGGTHPLQQQPPMSYQQQPPMSYQQQRAGFNSGLQDMFRKQGY